MITRRSFLAALSCLPFVGKFIPSKMIDFQPIIRNGKTVGFVRTEAEPMRGYVTAGEAIHKLEVFHVPGVNFVNPVTLVDTGHVAYFCARRDIAMGETIRPDDYWPQMRDDGPYQNVTRSAHINELAIQGWTSPRQRAEWDQRYQA